MSTHPKAALMHTPSNGDVADLHGFSCFRGVSLSLFFPPFFAHSSFTFSALYYLDSCLFPAGLVGWEFRVFSVRIQSLCLLTIMTMNKLQLCTAGHGAFVFLTSPLLRCPFCGCHQRAPQKWSGGSKDQTNPGNITFIDAISKTRN